MDNTPPPITQVPEVDEIGLLDILVTLAENIKLLILGPLAAGLLALGVSFVWPQTFESVAVLQAEPATASLMTTAAVLDPVAEALGLRKDATAEEARQALRERIKTSMGRNDKLLTLTASGKTPEQAQATASELLAQIYAQTQPRGSRKVRLERQLAEAEARMKSNPSSAFRTQILELEAELEGVTAAQVLQAPTLPEKAISPKKGLTAIMTTLTTGFLLVVWVFIRSSLRKVQDPESLAKLNRVKHALGLRTH